MSENRNSVSAVDKIIEGLTPYLRPIANKTIGNMEMKGAEDATITIKVAVHMERTSMNGPYGMTDITKPSFKFDINSVMQIKDKRSGSVGGDILIEYDDKTGEWFIREIDDGQTNLFDQDDDVIDGECREVEQAALPEGIKGLPVHDAEFTEVTDSDGGTDAKSEPGTMKPITPFEWLKSFVGQSMSVHENGDNYTVRTEGGKVILSSAADISNPFWCSAEKLSQHVGCELVCVGYGQDEVVNVSIECEEHGVVLFDLDAPEEEEPETMEYDDPE